MRVDSSVRRLGGLFVRDKGSGVVICGRSVSRVMNFVRSSRVFRAPGS